MPKAKTPRPSLRSLAKACGISYQTVSRIMNGQAELHRPETVERVERMASKMGYRRNLLARGMLTGKSMTIGVMLPYYINREFNTGILEGIQLELSKRDYAALLISVDGTKDDIKHSHQLIERRVDGVIFRSHPFGESDAYLHELARHDIPLVSVIDVEQTLDRPIDFVGVDEVELGKRAAAYLLSLGHKTIGFTRIGHMRFDTPLQERHQAFTAAVEAGGGKVLSTPHSNVPDFDEEQVTTLLARKRNRPTAIFCSVDDIGFKTMEVATKLGLKIPQDLAIIGSSNYFSSQYVRPGLTSFDLEPEEIGRQAAELLLRRISASHHSEPVTRIHVSPTLVVRESC